MDSVLLWGEGGKNQNVRVHKQRKKERIQDKVKTKRLSKTLVAFDDMQQQQKGIGDGKITAGHHTLIGSNAQQEGAICINGL